MSAPRAAPSDLSDQALQALAARAGEGLLAIGWRVATAESCTGGWVAKCLTDIPGSSRWFERGYVTYSNAAKTQLLGVPAGLIESDGAVSRRTAEQMACGALARSGVQLALAVTGIAGPDGGAPGKPVGLVWFGLAQVGAIASAEEHHFPGDRAAIRRASVATALQLLIGAALPAGPSARAAR